MRTRVLIITGVFYPEPVVSAGIMKDLADELSKKYDVTVLRPRPSRPMGFQMPDYDYDMFPFEVLETDSFIFPASSLVGRFRESYSMGDWCRRYIRRHCNEICFIYNAPWHMIGRNMIAKTAIKYGIPYITPVQDVYPESLFSKLPRIPFLKRIIYTLLLPSDRFLLSHASKVHTISEKMVDYLSSTRGLKRENFVAIRNWQDERDFVLYDNQHQEERKDVCPFTFMYLGNVGPLAGLEILFKAFKEASLPNARLVIAGSGSAKKELMSIAELYKDCAIHFWEVPSGRVPEIQAKADVMCLPVKKGYAIYSIPSKLPAYMFSKKPILACVDEQSDTAICIKNSNAGWVAFPNDVKSISSAMQRAFLTPLNELKKMGNNGFDFAMENFSRTNNLKRLSDACIEAIENRHRQQLNTKNESINS